MVKKIFKVKMNQYIIPRESYEDVSRYGWVCELPDSGTNYDPDIVNPTEKMWWIENVIDKDPFEKKIGNENEKDEVKKLKILKLRMMIFNKCIV